ncbi:chromate efflux transporter [Salipiger sp. PrR002]|uniref:chromate efflux transporter n=1 Tax=Salipiger sp. PrR002 TaxID=2706489 RepID=UPI0013B7F697|nr:chromate efflux transporter [Salipiger sp. PrR002]NDV98119.1 chromate efflux transporter [Salipiger sp. PrR002]NDW57094.1 chromate efflux transporter [Salipiger sp. PrR004]
MTTPAKTPLSQLFLSFLRIGLLSFGGPAAQIALLHREIVEERGWLSERQYLQALSFCMLLPGPEAMQLATWAGWRLRGVAGGLIAGGLFVVPGALVIAALALAYSAYGARPEVTALMLGVKATVIALVAFALMKLGRKVLSHRGAPWIALAAFAALYVLHLPFPLVIACAGAIGWLSRPAAPAEDVRPLPAPVTDRLWVWPLWVTLWFAPMVLAALAGQTLLYDIGMLFSKLAVFSFGGAYAVLAWLAQEAVSARGWLDPAQMADALGLAETTPGPLILVTQFVGMLTGYAEGGWPMALAAGAMVLWVTFVPCFLWIFAFAPHLERLLARPRLQGALDAITAAVLGVIANLTLWFALHVLFAETWQLRLGPIAPELPVLQSWRPGALALTLLAALLLGPLGRSVPLTLAVTAAAGLLLTIY